VEEPDINASIEERKIVGLGLFLVSKNADEFQYERAKNKNVIRITKMVKMVERRSDAPVSEREVE